jgi:hypothetical protein
MIDTNTESARPSAAARYTELATSRQPFLDRARACAKLTIPSLIPAHDGTYSGELYQPYQSLGANGVNNLASKLTMAMLPTAATFFRLKLEPKLERKLAAKDKERVEKALSVVEQKIMAEVDRRQLRPYANETFKHLIVGGNVLQYLPKRGGCRIFPITQFVICRDWEGTLLEIVIKERVSPNTLPKSVREVAKQIAGRTASDDKNVDVYTWARKVEDKWEVHQEVGEDTVIPGSSGTFTDETFPFIALRWTRIDGEAYGRGLCEEYFGDLSSMETLSKVLLEGAAAAARVLYLVQPGGNTDPEDIEKAPNLAVRMGHKDEVTVLGLEKFADFGIAKQTLDEITKRLQYAFLLFTAVQRDAERVTAEEVRRVASEIETALGGVYSVLAMEYQLPLVRLVQSAMESKKDLPKLDRQAVYPTVVTGFDALGRSQEATRLIGFLQTAYQNLGEQVVQFINPTSVLNRLAASFGIDDENLVLTQDQVNANRQQSQVAELASKAAPAVVKAVSDNNLANKEIQKQA